MWDSMDPGSKADLTQLFSVHDKGGRISESLVRRLELMMTGVAAWLNSFFQLSRGWLPRGKLLLLKPFNPKI